MLQLQYVPEKGGGTLKHFQGTFTEIDSGHLKTVLGHIDTPWLTSYLILFIVFVWGVFKAIPLYISDKVITQVYDTTKIIGKSSITWSIDTDIDHPKRVIFM